LPKHVTAALGGKEELCAWGFISGSSVAAATGRRQPIASSAEIVGHPDEGGELAHLANSD